MGQIKGLQNCGKGDLESENGIKKEGEKVAERKRLP